MRISEFLAARYDEDEVAACAANAASAAYGRPDDAFDEAVCLAANEGGLPEAVDHMRRWSPELVLADIAAKRRLVELCATWIAAGERVADGRDMPALLVRTEAITAETVLRALAQPYAEHADFDPAWRV